MRTIKYTFDETNDDPSNLAMMSKYLHTAYHIKHVIHKKAILDLNGHKLPLKNRIFFFPTRKPTVQPSCNKKRFNVVFRERGEDGLSGDPIKLSWYRGKKIITKEEAQTVANSIWAEVNGDSQPNS